MSLLVFNGTAWEYTLQHPCLSGPAADISVEGATLGDELCIGCCEGCGYIDFLLYASCPTGLFWSGIRLNDFCNPGGSASDCAMGSYPCIEGVSDMFDEFEYVGPCVEGGNIHFEGTGWFYRIECTLDLEE